jgi:hypothetical protein
MATKAVAAAPQAISDESTKIRIADRPNETQAVNTRQPDVTTTGNAPPVVGEKQQDGEHISSASTDKIRSQTVPATPPQPENDLGSRPVAEVLQPERDTVTLVPPGPEAPYVYINLDDQTFHTTLSVFVQQAQAQYAEFGLTLYYRVLPGLQDAERRFKEHEGNPTYSLDGCKGIEEYIKKLSLKPATVRKWRQRDKERQFMREVKLLAGRPESCPECGQGKKHARSCSHYVAPPPPPPESETEAKILAEQCLRMTKALLGPSIEPLPERVRRVIRMAESVQEAAAGGRYDAADFAVSFTSPETKSEPAPGELNNLEQRSGRTPDMDDTAADALRTALAGEPDRDVASKMLTEYLHTVAAQFANEWINIKEVSAKVEFAGRTHRIMPGDWLEKRDKDASSMLSKCVGVAEFMKRRRVQEWREGKWQKERVVFSEHEPEYRVITKARAHELAPEAFPVFQANPPEGL